MTPQEELAQIDAELAKRGNAPKSDELAQIDAELARRAKPPGAIDYVNGAAKRMGAYAIPGGAGIKLMGLLGEAADAAGGAVTDFAAPHMSPEMAAGAGAVTNMAVNAAPTVAGGAAGKAVAPAFEWAGRRVMQSALKPTRATIDSGKAGKAITTLLDEGINATEGGAAMLREKIGALNEEVKTILRQYPNASVDKAKVAEAFNGVFEKALKQGTPQEDLAIIQKTLTDFMEHPLFANVSKIPLQLAQEIKQGVWRKLGDKSFGKGLVPDSARESQKAIGTGLRQGIEEAAPAVGPVNAQQGEYINALKQVERRTGIEGNKNILGLGALSPSIEHALVWMLDRSPAGKSLLARALYSGQEEIPAMAGRVVGSVTPGAAAWTGRKLDESGGIP